MKAILADTYNLYIVNSKNTRFPREYKNHKIIWNMREVLLAIWEGNLTELVLPELGTPGYDYEGFIEDMVKQGQVKNRPKLKYYKLNIVKKKF